MNKEAKELIKEIKEFSIEYCHNPYYDYTLTKEEVELLLDYINQLETNIEEAIEYVKNHIHQETYTGYMDAKELMKLVSLLERG